MINQVSIFGKKKNTIGILDAEYLGGKSTHFPNLACMKISSYYKAQGFKTELVQQYEDIDRYDKVFISKVFTDTPFPGQALKLDNVEYGGTGFYFDKAEKLPNEIEHIKPDYELYDVDFSLGFLTRGCFRRCDFCINKNSRGSIEHSPLEEFYDPKKKYIYLLDDNFLASKSWKRNLSKLQSINKPFCFKQGLDVRLLDDEKCSLLFNSKYYGDYLFAFDDIKDYELVEEKLKLIRKHTNKTNIKFYVLVGFKSVDIKDIEDAFKRIQLLRQYDCLPYIMRYQSKNAKPWKLSEFKGLYIQLARWCNQPNFFKKMSLEEFCLKNQERNKNGSLSAPLKVLMEIKKNYPELVAKYFK